MRALGERPGVSVVIPARHAARTLRRAVDSALDQHGVAGDEIVDEVVIAVDVADSDTRAVADELATAHREVAVVDNPGGSTPAALNRAVAASSGQVVVRLDAHAQLPQSYVATAVATLGVTGAANVGGRQVPGATAGFAAAVAAAMRSRFGAGGAVYRVGGRPGPVETVYLGVFRREALDAVGGFDETLVRNQDYELNHRLRAAGHTVWFDPDLSATYQPRSTMVGLARQYYDYGRWKPTVLRLHPRSLRARQLAPPGLVVGLLVGLVLTVVGLWQPLALVGVAYLTGLAVAALAAARPVSLAPAVALALATMHLAWGVGFLRGAATGRPH